MGAKNATYEDHLGLIAAELGLNLERGDRTLLLGIGGRQERRRLKFEMGRSLKNQKRDRILDLLDYCSFADLYTLKQIRIINSIK